MNLVVTQAKELGCAFGVLVIICVGCTLVGQPPMLGKSLQSPSPSLSPLEVLHDTTSQSADLVRALVELTNKGEKSNTVLYVVRQLLTHESPDVRRHAALLFAYSNGDVTFATPDLVIRLKDEKNSVRSAAALALGAMKKEAECALPPLVELLSDEDPYVRGTAAAAIDSIAFNSIGVLVPSSATVDSLISWDAVTGVPDKPEGSMTTEAKRWWEDTGSLKNWGDCSGN